jgi:hypothetical protein
LLSGFWVSASEEQPFSENCEIVASLSPSQYLIYTNNVGRYSNTLLVSLNNRISIRDAESTGIVHVNRNPTIPLAITVRSDVSTYSDSMSMENEQLKLKFSNSRVV